MLAMTSHKLIITHNELQLFHVLPYSRIPHPILPTGAFLMNVLIIS
jgi:hypothetical protein